jgi:uncharacterized protein involved in type VI secretion and phage assembly
MTWLSEAGMDAAPAEGQQFMIALAEVINTIDSTGAGRVQVQLPWLPGAQPWARVAVPAAGSNRGLYLLPHEGDEVLLAFNRGDVSDCYVVGSLWTAADPPPRQAPLDPTTKIVIRTEVGHEIELDDLAQSISITTSTGHSFKLAPSGIKMSTSGDSASVSLGQAGDVTIEATTSLTLRAQTVKIEGRGQVKVESSGNVSIDGGATCQVKASMILLN